MSKSEQALKVGAESDEVKLDTQLQTLPEKQTQKETKKLAKVEQEQRQTTPAEVVEPVQEIMHTKVEVVNEPIYDFAMFANAKGLNAPERGLLVSKAGFYPREVSQWELALNEALGVK